MTRSGPSSMMLQLVVGDDRGDLDDQVARVVETGHLEIHPNQHVGSSRRPPDRWPALDATAPGTSRLGAAVTAPAARSTQPLAGRRPAGSARGRGDGSAGPARTRPSATTSRQPPQNRRARHVDRRRSAARPRRRAARARRDRRARRSAATPRRRSGCRGAGREVGVALGVVDRARPSRAPAPGGAGRASANTAAAARVGVELAALDAVVVGVEHEAERSSAPRTSTTRASGWPSAPTVASVIAFGSVTPAVAASAYQRCHCSSGSAATSATSRPAVSYWTRRAHRSARRPSRRPR